MDIRKDLDNERNKSLQIHEADSDTKSSPPERLTLSDIAARIDFLSQRLGLVERKLDLLIHKK